MNALSGTAIGQARGARAPRRPKPIVYPDSDGKPMAETELHVDELLRLLQILRAFFALQPDVYVAGNLILYYEEGNPRASVSPDVMVVKGVPKLPRRDYYLLWEEGVPPCFVIEVASRTTRLVDRRRKWELYARLGVREYILYDPRFPGLETRYPPLEGYRLGPNGYEPLGRDAEGALLSGELGLRLVLEQGLLQLYDPRTGERLLTPDERAEIAADRAEAEAARAESEAARASNAERRAATEAEARHAEAAALRAAERRIAELEALLREKRPPME
jgi:Uma2 family endonuclease